MVYNIISCSGWETGAGWVASLPCMKARIGVIILFFLVAIIRKWGAEEWEINFSFWLSIVGGVISYLIVVTLSGSFKWALVIALGVALFLGYGSGFLGLGESDGGE